jgi:hypothetical protein
MMLVLRTHHAAVVRNLLLLSTMSLSGMYRTDYSTLEKQMERFADTQRRPVPSTAYVMIGSVLHHVTNVFC